MPISPREGQPVWIDYTCQEFESTTEFYSEIFGWEFNDQGPDFGHYTMITKGGATVGGAMRAVNMDGTPNPLAPAMWTTYLRSEEHTSELQSRFDLVCRLLLEKKKHRRTSI